MHQLNLLTDAALLLPVETPSLPRPGAALLDSVSLVIEQIPKVGHARGTYRERLQGPLAYLYFRPDKIADDVERRMLFEVAAKVTGTNVREAMTTLNLTVPIWVRINGERARLLGDGRQAIQRVSSTHPDDAAWCLSLVDYVPERFELGTRDFFRRLRAGASAMGCPIQGMTRPKIFARSIHQLVLASLWTPTLAPVISAWILLASQAEPMSADWVVRVDLAETQGKPWAEGVALLGRRSEQDPIRRALAWAVDWVWS